MSTAAIKKTTSRSWRVVDIVVAALVAMPVASFFGPGTRGPPPFPLP